jgi:hypothetical protein
MDLRLEPAEIPSAADIGITLLAISGIVRFESIQRLIQRLIHPPAVEGRTVLVAHWSGSR